MRNIKACLYVEPLARKRLEQLIGDGKTAQKIVKRATIVLLSGRGLGTTAIMRSAGVSKPSVWRWQEASHGHFHVKDSVSTLHPSSLVGCFGIQVGARRPDLGFPHQINLTFGRRTRRAAP
jgi:hypothetical protein